MSLNESICITQSYAPHLTNGDHMLLQVNEDRPAPTKAGIRDIQNELTIWNYPSVQSHGHPFSEMQRVQRKSSKVPVLAVTLQQWHRLPVPAPICGLPV